MNIIYVNLIHICIILPHVKVLAERGLECVPPWLISCLPYKEDLCTLMGVVPGRGRREIVGARPKTEGTVAVVVASAAAHYGGPSELNASREHFVPLFETLCAHTLRECGLQVLQLIVCTSVQSAACASVHALQWHRTSKKVLFYKYFIINRSLY